MILSRNCVGQRLGNENSITFEQWPVYDEELAKENIISIAIQVNGKLRANIEIDANTNANVINANADANACMCMHACSESTP